MQCLICPVLAGCEGRLMRPVLPPLAAHGAGAAVCVEMKGK